MGISAPRCRSVSQFMYFRLKVTGYSHPSIPPIFRGGHDGYESNALKC